MEKKVCIVQEPEEGFSVALGQEGDSHVKNKSILEGILVSHSIVVDQSHLDLNGNLFFQINPNYLSFTSSLNFSML